MGGESGGSLVAVRRERERAIATLTDAFSGDLLDVDEFERRIDLAHQATSLEALREVTADLAPSEGAELAEAEPAPAETALAGRRPDKKTLVAVLGGVERAGSWRVPRRLRVISTLGGASLDFREARLPPGVSEVRIFSMLGGVEIIVPPGLAVDCEGIGVLGGFETVERCPETMSEDEPLLRVSGIALLGGVEITTRLPGESERQAKRRRRKERKALRRAAEAERERDRLTSGSD